jgi:lysophospholipase L1-like esterase
LKPANLSVYLAPEIPNMKRQTLLTFLSSALLCAATTSNLFAQGAPAGFGGRGPAAPAGPPAPVPAQVAIPHPSSQELDTINADLKKFIEKSPDKELLTKYEGILKVQMPRDNACIRPVQTGVRTTARHNGFVNTATNSAFDILFEGDSITDWWQQNGAQGGTGVFSNYFGGVKVANFAVAGDTTQGVLWGLQNGEGQGHKPKAVMLMIGTNNGSNSAEEVAEGVGAIVLELRKDFPDAKILLLAIFPRGAGPTDSTRVKNDATNKLIAKLNDGKHVFFMNINDKFLDAQGRLIGFRGDNLHPNAVGYEAWAKAVAPTLLKWAK